VKDILQGKRLAIRVRDARVAFDFRWNGQRFTPSAPQAQTDLAISANAQDFCCWPSAGKTRTRCSSTAAW
jgi:predicted lipid carrier protein YhbT